AQEVDYGLLVPEAGVDLPACHEHFSSPLGSRWRVKGRVGWAPTARFRPHWLQGLLVPGLDDGLLGNLAALEFEHGDAEYLCAVRISASLRKGEAISFGEADLDIVRHGAAAEVVPESVDRRSTLHFTRPARRIVAIDDAQDGVVGVETCERWPVAPLDGAL